MNIYKISIFLSISVLFSACESMPQNMQTLGTNINKGIKSINDVLATPSSNSTTQGGQTSTSQEAGMLTNAQCQNAQGKTKAQIENMAKEKLTDARAYSLTSFAVTYNFKISDKVNRYGMDSRSKAICSLTFEGNQPSSKVLHWSVIG